MGMKQSKITTGFYSNVLGIFQWGGIYKLISKWAMVATPLKKITNITIHVIWY